MSYAKRIDDFDITFEDEESYLNLRLDYLQSYPPSSLTFLQFLESKFQAEDCEDISIHHDFTISGGTTSTYPVAESSSSVHFITFDPSTNSVIDTNSYPGIPPLDIEYNFNNNLISPVEEEKKEKKKEELPDDPIDSRFDILDFGEEDNEI